jgi:ceramide glucosyltransferase
MIIALHPTGAAALAAEIIATVFTVVTLAALAYYLLVFLAGRSYGLSLRRPLPGFFPPVSILKPVKGVDAGMVEAFRSHCVQDYPSDYEILFGVRSLNDPAVAAIEALQREFPDRAIRIVHCPKDLGPNGKIGTLAQLAPEVRYDHLLVNDSDIRVSPRYLRGTMPAFATPAGDLHPVGMVTALYRGRAHGTVGSRLEALGIATDFMPGVLTSRWLERGLHFGMGSTLALTRQALEAIGGFLPLTDRLADDYELGAQVSRAGYRIELAREVAETSVPAYRFSEFWDHQLRWARAIRDSRPLGYLGMLVSFGMSWAVANLIASAASIESIALFVAMLSVRVGIALVVGVGLLGDDGSLRNLWLLPLRDLVAVAVWFWSFADDHVMWRGEKFLLRRGRLIRTGPASGMKPAEDSTHGPVGAR